MNILQKELVDAARKNSLIGFFDVLVRIISLIALLGTIPIIFLVGIMASDAGGKRAAYYTMGILSVGGLVVIVAIVNCVFAGRVQKAVPGPKFFGLVLSRFIPYSVFVAVCYWLCVTHLFRRY
jgi:hypothetical protein